MNSRKGQVFIITLVFLVALIFTMQTLLSNYGKIDLSPVPKRADTYIIENIETSFQTALDSSSSCYVAQSNVKHLKDVVERSFYQGSTITVLGKLTCPWTSSPQLIMNVTVSSGDGAEVWKTLELSRT